MPESIGVRETWAEAIRVERARRRLDQADVAEMSGIDQRTISKAEQGRASIETFEAIARALDIDLISGATS